MLKEPRQGPVFIVGAPRTGTTMVMNILNRQPLIGIFDELHFFEIIWRQRARLERLGINGYDEIKAHLIQSRLEKDININYPLDAREEKNDYREINNSVEGIYCRIYGDVLKEYANGIGKLIWGDSDPASVYYIDNIIDWFPQSKIIALMRDPRAYLASAKNSYRTRNGSGVDVLLSKYKYNPVTKLISFKLALNCIENAKEKYGHERVIIVKYEDLVSNPKEVVKKLCWSINVEFFPEMINVAKTNTSYRKNLISAGIYKDSIDRWRQHLSKGEIILAQFLCGKEMEKYQYSLKDNIFADIFGLLKIVSTMQVSLIAVLVDKIRKRDSLREYATALLKGLMR